MNEDDIATQDQIYELQRDIDSLTDKLNTVRYWLIVSAAVIVALIFNSILIERRLLEIEKIK
jgi:hypothetical protein